MASFTEKQLFDRLWASFTTDGSGNIAMRTAAQGLAADSVNDTHIDFGTGANQVSGVDIPLADAGGWFTTDNVEAALQQLGARVDLTGAPTDATYIVQTANGTLTNEQALGALATGLLRNTTTTGVLSIAVAGTDFYAPGSTDVAVADGGTGASTAANARTNLGLAIGTDVQAYDAKLAAFAGLTGAANKLPYFTAASTMTVADLTAFAITLLDDTTQGAMRTTLGLTPGTNVQAWDSDLDTLAAISPANDDIIQRKSGAWTNRTMAQLKTDLTLNLVDNTSNATERAATATLTNKRVTPRVGTTTSSATPTINTDNVDFYSLTALTVAITSFTTNLSGTPTDGQTLWIAITGTAARAITWGATFEASTVALPTTTVTTARLDVGFVWNAVTSKWRCVATA